MHEELLKAEPERTMYEYKMAWEGEREEDFLLADALIRYLPVRWAGVNGMVMRQRYDVAAVDRRLDELIEQETSQGRRYLWIVGPSSAPTNLGARLLSRGYGTAVEWDGLVLTDLSQQVHGGLDVVVEPLSVANAEGFARVRSELANDPAIFEERLASAHRYLAADDHHGVHIQLARLSQDIVGYVVLRTEPNGVAYFRDAYTMKHARRHGVYLALVARRLALAREAGCTIGVVQANRNTSSPILQKRGWRRVSWVTGYARPQEGSDGW